ncbi:unnamed protein product [Orchesella dallaii]|uniref:RING-type domain-containing protein n=1 Tax=Orchesella dallaii TaxID=48710 RepID=A0ABP1QAV7_9HEXA
MAADDYHPISKHGKTTAASAVSPSSIKKPKERVPAKPDMPEINCYLMCQLCSGYLIDATAIIECQHTFCKSCILKYLETNSYCPICDVQLNKAKPHLSLRSDIIIQRLVYKLVPGLLVSEIRRRRDFFIKNGMDPVEAAESASNSIAAEIEASSDLSTILSLDDVVSLSVEYFRSDESSSVPGSKGTDTNGKQSQQQVSASQNQQTQQQHQKSNVKSNNVSSASGDTTSSVNATISDVSTDNSEQANDRRYLQCPAAVSVGLLKKFIRMKYGLSDDYRVDLLYNGDRDSILENDLTLLDVAFIFKWNKDDPMMFQYRIFERPVKSISVYSGMKRPAPSVMDEPPDDDTASGPHNRSSMFPSSSAPSSKLPRLTDSTSTSSNQGSVPNNNTSGKSTTTSTSTTANAADEATSTTTKNQCSKSTYNSTVTPSALKVEKEEAEEDEDDDEDDEEDYELVERKSHMKGIKSSRRRSIKESMKRSVASNLRSHIPRSHSTDSKSNTTESERDSKNENSLSSSNSKRDAGLSKSSGKKKGNSNDGKEQKDARGRLSSSSSSKGSSSTEQQQTTGSLKLSISTSGVTPVVSSSIVGEKKEPLKLSLGSVLAKGNKSPERKHHKHKHHHKLRHRDKQIKGVASVVCQKPLKLSFTLSPPSGTITTSQPNNHQTQANQSQNKSGSMKQASSTSSQDSGIEVKEPAGRANKPVVGMQNFNNSARTSSSAHGHLNNISKSISVSVNTNANNNSSTIINKGDQYGNKGLSPAELIPKNTGIEIQPTTIPISSSHGQISQHTQQQSNVSSSGSSGGNNNSSHKHSHPLLPDSVHVPKSVTLIPVNPNSMGMSNSSIGKGSSSQEKGGSGSQGNQNRINAHTFTHPITNKSLHQITVTEVPPPPKPSGSPSMMGNNISNNTHSSISGSTSNPIEKVIANAANNKPQFNGPGSMEITKIYCGTTKENPAKKLKDRKGLDISITGTGINVSVNKSSQKLEETLRQKVNIAIGGGNGSISVTPAPNNSSQSSGNNNVGVGSNNNSGSGQVNKMKSISTAASLLSGKMPPGITIGPATAPSSSGISGSNNNASSNSNPVSVHPNTGNNNIVKGLGFTLPPHLTAHPHIPNNMKNANNKIKSDKSSSNNMNMNNSRLLNKDSISIIGKGNGNGGQQPPPVEITISAAGGNKSHANITSRGINIMNKSKINDPLASIFDITQGIRKSPSPTNNAKDTKTGVTSTPISITPSSMPPSNSVSTTVSSSGSNKNMVSKRPYELTGASQGSNNKKVKESPEVKRGRSASTSSEPGKANNSSSGKSRDAEIPLDLSGRSTRTTPPITIPHRESSKSPSVSASGNTLSEKRAPSKSPETVKAGITIAPSTISNNFLSTKINQKQHTKEPFKGQSQSVSVSKSSPNQASKIGSIVENLAQKQAQQQLQIQKNSHNHQQQSQQQSHHQHRHHSTTPTSNSSASITSPNSSNINAHSGGSSNNNVSNMKGSGSGSVPSIKVSPSSGSNNSMNKGPTLPNSSGLGSPITGSSMGSPAIPITSPSPPGDHLRNLWTLSDTAARQGKLNSMNELLAAASLFSPPGHPHPLAGQHQLAGSPSGAAAFNPNMFAQFSHHLASLGNKIPPGMFDPHIMAAALNAHNAHAAGLRMHHFVGSMSPPLNMPNAFYPHGAPTQQPSPVSPVTAGGLKIPNVTPKPPSNTANTGVKINPNPIPFAPLFSHSVPVSSPKSPNSSILPAPGTAKSPTAPIANTNIPPALPFTTSASSMVSNALSNHSNSTSSSASEPKHSFSSNNKGNSGSVSQHHDSSSTTHTSNSKSTKINGTMSTALPVFPPGIHNPLLSSRSSNSSSSNNSSSTSNLQSGSNSATSKTFSPFASKMNSTKGGIPNSMKISNFLPSKPKDSASDASAEATITSGSNYHIPVSQTKPNFSLSPTRPISNSTLNSIPSLNIPKGPSIKESPISPVKSIPTSATAILNANPLKPSSMTCASLLRPDTTFSKPSSHPMMNSLSPTKGDQGSLGLCSSRSRTPSSESALSPGSLNIKAISPGAVSSNKSPNGSKDLFRVEESKSQKTSSPTKDEITSKKQIGNIPMGPSDACHARNFNTSTSAMQLLSPTQQHQQGLSLSRPIPIVPGFLNNSLPLSSTISVSHAATKDTLPLPSPSAKPLSPVKLASPIKINEPHLPSPVFPFPGVSVPVQVKLQDDETEIVKVAPAAVTALPVINAIPFKQEVKQVESKVERIVGELKSSNSSMTDQTQSAEKMTAKPFQSLETEARKIKADVVTSAKSVCEIPAKVQKVEIQVSSTIKNELVETATAVSENKQSSESTIQAGNNNGATTNESEAQREPTVTKVIGEKNVKESKGDVADLPHELVSSPSQNPLENQVQTFSPVKAAVDKVAEAVTEKTLSAPVQSPTILPPPSISAAALEEMQTKPVEAAVETASKVEDKEEKSVTQISVDIAIPKSDETSMQVKHPESTSLEISQEKETGQIICENNESGKIDDVEMDKVEPVSELLGQNEQQVEPKIVISMEMDNEDDNQMEIDIEESNDKMDAEEEKHEEEKIEADELKEDEDVDVEVDVVDVGVDEPMEINADGIIQSLEHDGESSEKLSEVERASIDSIANEQALSSSPMEVVDDEIDEDSNSKYEIIEFQPESTASRDDVDVDAIEKNGKEYVSNDFVEESEDVIKRQKLEMSLETQDDDDDVQLNNDSEDVTLESSDLVDKQASEHIPAESNLYPENEASNLSQDDSECGNLIIDLDPAEEQLQEDDENEEEIEELSQEEIPAPESPPKTEPEATTTVVEIAENEGTSEESVIEPEESATVPSQETAGVDNQSFSLLLNTETESELENEQQNQQCLDEVDEKQALSPADDDNTLMESIEPQVAFGEPLNQDSIPNQITINPPPIEVNGVIKCEEESKNREEDVSVPEVVAECPHVEDANTVAAADHDENDEKQEEVVASIEEPFIPAASMDEAECERIDALENNASELNDVPVSDSQLAQEDAFSTLTSEDNKNTADDQEVVEEDKKIEEEQLEEEQLENSINEPLAASVSTASVTEGNGEEAVVENYAGISPPDNENEAVHLPENDNNIGDSQNISVTDDSILSPAATDAPQEQMEESETTAMEIDESNDLVVAEPDENEATENETVPIIDDVVPQTESDNVVSTVDSSNSSLPSQVMPDETATMMEEEESLNIDDVAVISATATITTASAVATEAVALEEENNALATPTTSTSSVAIKLDISTNDDGNSNDAESLVPPSNSNLIPSGINTSNSSSSSSSSSSTVSPVEVPATGLKSIGSQSLETFGKVAAGLLASATSTINNNNNNTSLAPTTCEAMSIATTNANA